MLEVAQTVKNRSKKYFELRQRCIGGAFSLTVFSIRPRGVDRDGHFI